MNTTENNKIIAEFMGLNLIKDFVIDCKILQEKDIKLNQYYYDSKNELIFKCERTAFPLIIVQENNYHSANINNCQEVVSELKYHSDWNWLMEVVKECYNKEHNENNYYEAIYYALADLDIEKVYNACIEFIKWYNEQQKLCI
jgi:hypothetical protein